MTEVGASRMPKVDFEKDKLQPYLVDQVKNVEKDNKRRFITWRTRLIRGRIGFALLSSIVLGIYGYTMVAVKRETFLDNFDEIEDDD